MPVQTLKIVLLAVLFAVFGEVSISAQPQGDEPRKIRKMVEDQLARIAETDRRIANDPPDGKLFETRADLYVELYRMLYSGYLSGFYEEKPPELSVAALTGKAIDDFSRALKSAPRAELYAKRGEMYAVRWLKEFRYFNWYEAVRNLESPEWRDYVGWRTSDKELKILAALLRNPDFANAENDFEKALKLSADAVLLKRTRHNLAKIYLERSAGIFNNLEFNKNLLAQSNPFAYVIFDEIERAAEHFRKSSALDRNDESKNSILDLTEAKYWTALNGLLHQAYIAEFYGDNRTALRALNEAEKYVDKNQPFSEFVCRFYPFRSRIHLKLGNPDAALADAAVKYPNPNAPGQMCDDGYEARGDALFAKGDYLSAVDDYTQKIRAGYSDTVYKKRGLAYIKLGEAEKAVADFTSVINHSLSSAEKYRLRAQAFRLAGNEKLALEDEEKARQIAKNDVQSSVRRSVYGKVVLPDGVSLDAGKVFVELTVDRTSAPARTSVDEFGRFIFRSLEAKDFRLTAYFDGTKNGAAVRFYGSTAKMNIPDKLVGPIIIKLDREEKLANRRTN